ncbi:hypothetical protein, partial [Effusibacillus consociatus]
MNDRLNPMIKKVLLQSIPFFCSNYKQMPHMRLWFRYAGQNYLFIFIPIPFASLKAQNGMKSVNLE